MTRSTSRGTFLTVGASALGVLGAGGGSAFAQATTPAAGIAPDGLAMPFPANPSLARGKDRALVLGGGGEYLLSWILGYAHALHGKGVDLDTADVIVGTSAGSVGGSTIAGGHLTRLTDEFDFFAKFPKIMADMIPTGTKNSSQLRAESVLAHSKDAELGTIQGIGRAAMAALNFDVSHLQLAIGILTGNSHWPSPKMHTTAVDCYTGERLVVSASAGIPITHAVSASMSVPGTFGPTRLKTRLTMDGGMCSTSTHCDLVSGVRRALVFSLSDGSAGGPRLSSMPNTLQQELTDLRAGGTKTMLVTTAANAKTNLLSPAEILPALRAGYAKGQADAPAVKAFWA